MSNKKQSSLEWFINQLEDRGYGWENPNTKVFTISIMESDYLKLKQMAKAMHKEEIEEAQSIAISNADMTNNRGYFDAEQYYNETFGGKDE